MNTNNKQIMQWSGRFLFLTLILFFISDGSASKVSKSRNRINTRAFLVHKIKERDAINASSASRVSKSKKRINTKVFLLHKIKERDAIIADLLSRIQVLEKLQGITAAATEEESSQSSPPSAPVAKLAQAPSEKESTNSGSAAQAPGEFKVDLQASQRALERTLAKTGVLLLPTGYLDSDISFNYSYRDSSSALVLADINGNPVAALNPRSRRNTFEPSIAFRLGLPFDTQFEFNLPYRFANESEVAQNFRGEITNDDSALGDVQIGIAKTLLNEAQWWPDLIARVTWDTGSGLGGLGNGGLLGHGIQSVTGAFSILKRQDPLAFFFNAGYTRAFTKGHYLSDGSSYNPGDTLSFAFGAQLAASADTSLSFAVNELFVSNSAQNGQTILGSDRNIGILSIGASSIISRNMFVNLSVGMGLTNDSPDYTAGITFSNRINLNPYLGIN